MPKFAKVSPNKVNSKSSLELLHFRILCFSTLDKVTSVACHQQFEDSLFQMSSCEEMVVAGFHSGAICARSMHSIAEKFEPTIFEAEKQAYRVSSLDELFLPTIATKVFLYSPSSFSCFVTMDTIFKGLCLIEFDINI